MLVDDSNIEICINYLEEGKCVLFLGPQFAMDEAGQKVHAHLKSYLQQTPFKDKLDFSYDNLFIFKNPKPRSGDKMRLNIQLKNKYQTLKPHEIYQLIPYIPFSAIISCSPDSYLKKAFKKVNQDIHFRYYSRKGASNSTAESNSTTESNGTIPENPPLPFLYNVFGYITDEESLITTYESFFKFIISIMGEEQQLPLELRNHVADAKIILFMGFDMTKWYIPLLIHKLNSFNQNDYSATALINKDNKMDEKTEKFFPIEMLVLEGDSIPTIKTLYNKLKAKGTLRAIGSQKENELKTLTKLVATSQIEPAFALLNKCYQDRSMDNREIIAIEARYQDLKKNKRLNLIAETDAGLEQSRIVNAMLDFIDELKE